MGAAVKFKQAQVPKQQGEQARLKVIKGPDAGAVFVLQGTRATIGRGEENDVVIADIKASRVHAELSLTQSGDWTVKDLGSANGVILNGRAARSGGIKTKNTLMVGDTLFEFAQVEAGTMMLMAPAASEQQIQAEQAGLNAQRAKVVAMGQFGGLAKNKPRPDALRAETNHVYSMGRPTQAAPSEPMSPKKLLLILAALGAGYFLFLDDGGNSTAPKKAAVKKGDEKDKQDLSKFLPGVDSPVVEKTAEQFYRSGFREYRVGNFLRARTQFETVLQMSPAHLLAKLYLENSNKAIEDEVKLHMELGRKALDSGKTRNAKAHYEAVLRLRFREQSDPAYEEAKSQLTEVLKKIGETN